VKVNVVAAPPPTFNKLSLSLALSLSLTHVMARDKKKPSPAAQPPCGSTSTKGKAGSTTTGGNRGGRANTTTTTSSATKTTGTTTSSSSSNNTTSTTVTPYVRPPPPASLAGWTGKTPMTMLVCSAACHTDCSSYRRSCTLIAPLVCCRMSGAKRMPTSDLIIDSSAAASCTSTCHL
jgi:hypothetical protein